ncbi:MAG: pyruvate kinase [Candidatus Caldarchaeum sp.]|uniref:Pyruvate kinase n=1 Tax=Caldiarchaeum subterraneum TaxID=311458 RepID=A0A7C5QDY6_CALS0
MACKTCGNEEGWAERARVKYFTLVLVMGYVKTKLACTLGPSLSTVEEIVKAISLGCRIFRINFSHGDPALWRQLAEDVRSAAKKAGCNVVLVGDLKAGSVRVAGLAKPVSFNIGETVEFNLDSDIKLPYPQFFKTVEVGDMLVADDGRVMLKVIAKKETSITAEAIRQVTLSPNKSIVIKGKEVASPDYLEASRRELETAVELGMDFVGLSFVRDAEEIHSVRSYLEAEGSKMGLIAKVETPSAVQNIDKICEKSDAVLIARGDLGMHFPLELVPKLQKTIIEAAYNACKPVIVATQLLGTMVNEPVPSRSEIVDVMSCVEDGVDVLMLTAETAVGQYPLESIQWLSNIAETYEKGTRLRRTIPPDSEVTDRFALAVVNLAESLAAKIAIFTMNGHMARRIARFKPVGGVIAATPNRHVLPRLQLMWGVVPLEIDAQSYADGLEKLEQTLEAKGIAEQGDTFVLTYGLVNEPVHIVKMKRYQ